MWNRQEGLLAKDEEVDGWLGRTEQRRQGWAGRMKRRGWTARVVRRGVLDWAEWQGGDGWQSGQTKKRGGRRWGPVLVVAGRKK